MKPRADNPGVYIPPPVFYALTFLSAVWMQKRIHLDDSLFHSRITKGVGVLFLLMAISFLVTSLAKFFKSKNTVVLIKPASSLQTNGVYSISRNPMYVGLLQIYLGITCFTGNWWNIILLPLLIFLMQVYVIKHEEDYLERAFGNEYLEYKKRVRRWL
jgi:protein-S-isoprenylcysteine O-methyltransferase Ste14